METKLETTISEERDELFVQYYENRKSEAPTALKEWIATYPAYQDELVSWATEIPALEFSETLPDDAEQDAKTYAASLNSLKRMGYSVQTEAQFKSLLSVAEKLGLSPKQFAAKLNLDRALLMKLEQRLIQVATIPQTLIEKLAAELKTGAEQVREYFNLPPTLAQNALYRADSTPQTAQQETFRDAVRNSLTLAEEQRVYWTNSADENERE